MHQDRERSTGWRARIGHVALLVALAVVPVLALNSFATADTGGGDSASTGRPGITDAQQQCLTDHGVTLPHDRSDGPRTAAQKRTMRQAARACGLRGPHGAAVRGLTDAQRQCLSDHGVDLGPSTSVTPPPPLSAEARAARQQAAEDCGLPPHGPRAGGAAGQI